MRDGLLVVSPSDVQTSKGAPFILLTALVLNRAEELVKGGGLQNAIGMFPGGSHPRRGQGREGTEHPFCSQLTVHKLKINKVSSLWTWALELPSPSVLQIMAPCCKTDASTLDGWEAFNESVV